MNRKAPSHALRYRATALRAALSWRALASLALVSGAAGLAPNAIAGGELSTMTQGVYECSIPGDAADRPWIVVEESRFVIAGASSYRRPDGRGTYLLKDDVLTFTRGPWKGRRFERLGPTRLRELRPDGSPGILQCARVSSAR